MPFALDSRTYANGSESHVILNDMKDLIALQSGIDEMDSLRQNGSKYRLTRRAVVRYTLGDLQHMGHMFMIRSIYSLVISLLVVVLIIKGLLGFGRQAA